MNLPKTLSPTQFAAKAFAEVCERADNAVTIDDRLKDLFNDLHEEFQYRVDKRIAFERWLKIQIEAAEAAEAEYKAMAAALTESLGRFKALATADLQSQPDIEWRGKLGKMWLQKSNPKVDYAFGDKNIDPNVIKFFDIPEEYVVKETVYKVDHAKLKADLQAGKTFKWATISQKEGVRFPKKAKAIEGDTNEDE